MIVHLAWGADGLDAMGPSANVIVIVDVLSFSTCVDVAVGRGATVYPYRWRDDSASTFATDLDAYLATRRGEGEYSLSPASLEDLPPNARLVLPSPNGSTLSLAAREHGNVLAGCLRNAAAVASACTGFGEITIIPAGERWPSGRLRPALEDLLGAGAIASHFDAASLSADARAAVAAFEDARPRLREALLECPSGRELVAIGFARDVELASLLNDSRLVPTLQDGAFRPLGPDPTR